MNMLRIILCTCTWVSFLFSVLLFITNTNSSRKLSIRCKTLVLVVKVWNTSNSPALITGDSENFNKRGYKGGRLTLTQLEPNVISLNHQCSLSSLYTLGWPTSRSHHDTPIMIMDSSKNGRAIIPFKKFSSFRLNDKLKVFMNVICL